MQLRRVKEPCTRVGTDPYGDDYQAAPPRRLGAPGGASEALSSPATDRGRRWFLLHDLQRAGVRVPDEDRVEAEREAKEREAQGMGLECSLHEWDDESGKKQAALGMGGALVVPLGWKRAAADPAPPRTKKEASRVPYEQQVDEARCFLAEQQQVWPKRVCQRQVRHRPPAAL
jgi:hypothetical protein